METRMEGIMIGFKITSHDEDNRLCNLSVTIKYDDNRKRTKSFKNVKVSGLLNSCLINIENENYEVGKYYESSLPSKDWKSNPMQLIEYTDKDGKDVMLLSTVSEMPSEKHVVKDMFDNEIVMVKYRHHKKSNYRRYRNYKKTSESAA